MAALRKDGHHVTGLGRSAQAAATVAADGWIIAALTTMSVADWGEALRGVDVVVNASGALQTGLRDNLTEIHVGTVSRLLEALQARPARLIQVSAAGVRDDAPTEFFRSKA